MVHRSVLISQQKVLRDALSVLICLCDDFCLVGDVPTIGRIRPLLRTESPDLVEIDIGTDPGASDVIDQVLSLKRAHPSIGWIALFDANDSLALNLQLELRLQASISKDQSCETMIQAMRVVAAGRQFENPGVNSFAHQLRSRRDLFAKLLSLRKQEILRYVAAGYTSKSIATRLHLSYRTVPAHRYRIMKRLDVKTLAGLLNYLRRHNLLSVILLTLIWI